MEGKSETNLGVVESGAASSVSVPSTPASPAVPQMDPVEVFRRNVRTMGTRQLSGLLKNKARKRKGSMMDDAWAIVLSTILRNSKQAGGRMEPYLR